MRSFTLLLLLAMPLFLAAQVVEPANNSQIIGEDISILKSDLIGLSTDQINDLSIGPVHAPHAAPPIGNQMDYSREDCFDAYIPVDPNTYTPVPRNDDGSLFIGSLGFTFSFCGDDWTSLYINTNGNLSFGTPVAQYSPDGFPIATPMVAPFWGDVDTRNTSCGQAWYELFSNYMIVTWEDVGWYNQQCSPLNSFQVIISDGTAGIIGVGNNIQFRYGDMEWTTGQASGGGPFGGFPATVGYNSGDNENFEQVGRFNQDNSNYDGPFGADDGVHWLDNKCFVFDADGGNFNLQCIDITRELDGNCLVNITAEEVSVTQSDGCNNVDISIDNTSFNCDDLGDNIVTITATSGGETQTCTAIVTILNGLCAAPFIDPVGPFCSEDNSVTMTANPPGGTWGGSAPGGIFDPGLTGPGTHQVTYTNNNACPPTTSINVVVNSNPVVDIFPDPPEFCEDDGSIEITATGSGGNGIYTYTWTTPFGIENGQTITASLPGFYEVTITDGNNCTDVQSTSVTVLPSPDVVIFDPGPICDTELAVQLQGSPTGGTWTGDYITPDGFIFPINIPPGFIQVTYTYTNNFGCASSATENVEILVSPDALAFNNGPFCEGGVIELYGTTTNGVNPTFSWTGPNGYMSDIQNPNDATEEGVYTLVVNANGCSSEEAITVVFVNEAPDAIALNGGPYCPGQDISLFGTTSTNGSDISYEWSGPGGYMSDQQNPTDAIDLGTYTLIVTVDGCESEPIETTVEQSNTPDALATNDGPYCTDEDISLFGSTNTSGTTITYDWSGPAGYTSDQQNPTDATQSGTYTLIIEVDGCQSDPIITEVIINALPDPTITGDDSFCEGDISTLDAGGPYETYEWTDGTPTQTLDVNATGTYSVTVTDLNGCTGETEINITVNPNPEPTIAGSTTFCTGFSTTLDAGGDYVTYLWSDTSEEQTLEVSAGGTYSVTVTDANGCTGVASVDIEESSSLNPVISGDLDFCVGDNTTLDVGSGFETYEWSDSTNGQTISVDSPGDYSVTVSDVNGCTGETTVSVIENQLPTVSISGNAPICTGASIILDAGDDFITYEWSNTGLNQTIEVSTGGTYSVTVTDANGCTNEASVDVEENPNPVPTITGDQSFCSGETVTLNAGMYDEYIWDDGTDQETLEITSGGTYSVTVTDANGCTGEDQITITENQLPEPNITGDLEFCAGFSTILTGPAGYDYDWSNGETSQEITISSDGPIGLTVTDVNGCTGEVSVSLTENPNPDPTISGSTSFCIGNTTIIDAGGPYSMYEWSNGTFNQTLEVSTPGDYTVTVTDGNGCTGETSVSITESESLMPVIVGDDNVCAGENSTLDAGAGFETYIWSNGADTQTIVVDTDGDYSVTVSDSQGCTGETSLTFIVNQNPVAAISGNDTFCEGDVSTLDAGPGFIYDWSNGDSTQTIDVTQSGIYSVIITDQNGCSDDTEINITVNPNPDPQITGPSSFCSGNTATLDAGAGYNTYFWSTGEDTQTITVQDGNNYSVTVSTVAGCTAETAVDVTENASLTPVILGDLEFCEGDNSILDAGTGYETYEWSTGENSQTITVTGNGNYGVIVTDTDGCSGSDNVSVNIFQNPDPIIAGSTTFCTGSFTTLDAGSYDNYIWSTGDTTQTIVVNTPGDYSVDVIDANGCMGSAFTSITESTSLSPVIAGEPAICTGGTTILDAGSGFNTYLWSDGSIGQTLEVSSPDDYSVTVSDAQGCTGETSVSVIENTPPVAELAQGPELCNTDAGGSIANLYDLIISGDNTGTWEDTDNSGAVGLFDNLNFDGIPAGDYNFTYTTNSAISPCDETSYSITLTILDCSCPPVSFNSIDPVCNSDGTIDLNTVINSAENGTWTITGTPPGGNPAVVNGQTFEAISADAGDYDLMFELNDMPPPGCPQTFSISLTVEQEMTAGTAAMPLDFCADESQMVILSDLLNGQDLNGTWTEVSSTPSQGGAFDPNNGTFDMTGQSDGVFEFQYSISPGGACPDDSEVVTVIVNELPTVIAGASIQLTCSDPVLSLDATGSSSGPDFDIQWTGGVVIDGNENSISPTVDQPGIYTLTITNTTTGCSNSDVVQVTQSNDVPNAFAGQDATLTCDDTETILQAGGNTGSGFEIEWQGPSINAGNQNDPNPIVDLAGIYILTITNTDNGCVSNPDTVIVMNNMDAPNVVIETPLNINCYNSEVDIIGTSQDPDVSYEWFDSNQNSIGTGAVIGGINTPGDYTLVVTYNQTGCSGSETIEVFLDTEFPVADAGTPQLINCYNPEVTIDGSGSTNGLNIAYEWTGPGIVSPPNGMGTAIVNLPGSYIISIQNLDNGCESFDTVIVDQNTLPPNANILEPDELDCTINEVTLDGTGSSSGNNYNYSWINDQGDVISSSLNVDVQNTGSYWLAVQDLDNGCVDTATVVVSENMNIPYSANFVINNPNCNGDEGDIAVFEVFGGTAPYIYSINDEVFTSNGFYPQLSPGSYNINLQDANGCEWDTTINIIEPIEVDLDLGTNLFLEMGDSAMVQAFINIPTENIDTLIWTPADLINCGDPECLQIGFSSFLTQTLTATLIDINGCVDEDQITVYMNREKRVFIPNAFTPNGDGENDLFMIHADQEQVEQITKFLVFNRWGEIVYEGRNFQPNNPEFGWDGKLRGEAMNPAVFVYLAEIEFKDGEVEMYTGDVTIVK